MIYPDIKLIQKENLPNRKTIDSHSHILILHSAKLSSRTIAYADKLLTRRKKLGRKRDDTTPVELDLPNSNSTRIVASSVSGDESSFELLTLARKMVASQARQNCGHLSVIIAGFVPDKTERLAEAVIAAVSAAAVELPSLKSSKKTSKRINRVTLYGLKVEHGFSRTLAEASGNALARALSVSPPNELTPGEYSKRVQKIARSEGWEFEFYDISKLKRKKAGAFLAVVQGSTERDAGIVRLRYKPGAGKNSKKLALVGKGICYDTGGTNLKPANYMFGMHEDMQGSAVALGCMLALSRCKVDFEIECWLALAINHIGPDAYKPNDVVTAANGKTIEVVHTDAEGRMVLADTLVFASREKPDLIIDFATLTGACVYSIGTAYSGIFTNRESFHADMIQAGTDSGERVWPFPMDKDFDDMLDSDIADVKQCSRESGVDHILAARFLQLFIENNLPWIHIDLAASNRKGGLAHIPTDTTGFGVRYTMNLLLDKKMPSPGGS